MSSSDMMRNLSVLSRRPCDFMKRGQVAAQLKTQLIAALKKKCAHFFIFRFVSI